MAINPEILRVISGNNITYVERLIDKALIERIPKIDKPTIDITIQLHFEEVDDKKVNEVIDEIRKRYIKAGWRNVIKNEVHWNTSNDDSIDYRNCSPHTGIFKGTCRINLTFDPF